MEDISDLESFINNAKIILQNFEQTVGWKTNAIESEKNPFVECTINRNHQVLQERLETHVKKCKWKELGYTKDEVDCIVSDEACQWKGSTIFTDDIVAEIAPGTFPLRTHDVYMSTLTREERLQVYDEVRSRLSLTRQKLNDPFLYKDLDEKLKQTSSDGQGKSNIELVKEIRDHKRRRQSYRAKNVHVTKRSQTEILREILANHMEELRQRWNPRSRSPSPAVAAHDRRHRDHHHEEEDRDRNRYEERTHEQIREYERNRERIDHQKSYNRNRYHEVSRDSRRDFRDRSKSRDHRYFREDSRDRPRSHDMKRDKRRYSPSPEKYAFVTAKRDVSVSSAHQSSASSSFDCYEHKDVLYRSPSDDEHEERSRVSKKHKKRSKRDRDEDESGRKKKKHRKRSPR